MISRLNSCVSNLDGANLCRMTKVAYSCMFPCSHLVRNVFGCKLYEAGASGLQCPGGGQVFSVFFDIVLFQGRAAMT